MVIDGNGDPLDSPDQLNDANDLPEQTPDPWWSTAWGSMVAAGFPQQNQPSTPTDKIAPPKTDD